LGLSEVGAGTGVGASGVIIFSMMLVDLLGAQDANRIATIRKFKKHRDDLFPLRFLKVSINLDSPGFV
jgi:hypothetical protein